MSGLSLPFCSFHCLVAAQFGDSYLFVLPLAAGALLAAASWWWRSSRSRQLLDDWAARNGFQIVQREYRAMRRGPFFWKGRGQTVYFVTVRDKDGLERSCWVRCGGWFTGLWSSNVEVSWLDLSTVSLEDGMFPLTLSSRSVLIIVFVIVVLAALLFWLMPKPPVPQI